MENKLKHIGMVICLSVVMVAFITKSKHEVVLTKQASAPIGPYSQAIKTDDHLFVSGQIALTTEGKMDTTTIEVECKQVMENIKAIVEAADMRMEQIVKTTIYTTDLKNFSRINEVYKTYFVSAPPARETVQVSALPKGAHLEISVMLEK